MATTKNFRLIENYIYLYNIDQFAIIPVYPESISDSMSANFMPNTPLARSAPIYSYQSSGPRVVRFSITLHRDMFYQINWENSTLKTDMSNDYVDTLINRLQACALPQYSSAEKMVDPPMVAVRFGNDIYIKGVVTGSVSVEYSPPILETNKYAVVTIGFEVSEVDPYDASMVAQAGSFRGLDKSLERRLGRVGSR